MLSNVKSAKKVKNKTNSRKDAARIIENIF